MDEVYKAIDLITPLVKSAGVTDLNNLFSQINSPVDFNQIYYELKDSSYFDVSYCGNKDRNNLRIEPNRNTYRYTSYEDFLKQSNPLKMIIENKYEFHNSQIGAVGENASSSNNTFQQSNSVIPIDFDLRELRSQLFQLKENLILNAKTGENFNSIAKIVEAQKELENGNNSKMLEYLKQSGEWVLGIAKDISVGVIVELITKS
jgi:hypothetical protein